MSSVDHYHAYVHDAASALGYEYGDTSPEWIHPFIHMIVVLTPVLLTAVAVYLIVVYSIRYKKNLAKKPDNIGIPAIDNKEAVNIPANNGCDFPKPLKLSIVSFSLSLVT